MSCSSLPLGLVIALKLSVSLLAQTTPLPIAVEKSVPTIPEVPVARNPELIAASERLQSSFGVIIKLGLGTDPAVSAVYDVTPIKAEHVANALLMLEWITAELKRYPEGFLKKFGSKNLVLANACKRRSKSAAGAGRKVRHQRWRIMRLLPQVKSGFTEISLWNIRSGAQDVPQGRRQGGLPSPSPFLRVPKTVTFSVRLQDMYPMREPIQHRSRQTLAPQHFRPILKR